VLIQGRLIRGQASDRGGGQVSAVEVSEDGAGLRWHPAQPMLGGWVEWEYLMRGEGSSLGAAVICRAVDDSGNMQGGV
jgi:hypothetical protein